MQVDAGVDPHHVAGVRARRGASGCGNTGSPVTLNGPSATDAGMTWNTGSTVFDGRAELGDRAEERARQVGRERAGHGAAARTDAHRLLVDRLRLADALELVGRLRELGRRRAPALASTTSRPASASHSGNGASSSASRPARQLRDELGGAVRGLDLDRAVEVLVGELRRRAFGEVGVEVRPRVAAFEHAPPHATTTRARGRPRARGRRSRTRRSACPHSTSVSTPAAVHRRVQLRDAVARACARDRASQIGSVMGQRSQPGASARSEVCRYTATLGDQTVARRRTRRSRRCRRRASPSSTVSRSSTATRSAVDDHVDDDELVAAERADRARRGTPRTRARPRKLSRYGPMRSTSGASVAATASQSSAASAVEVALRRRRARTRRRGSGARPVRAGRRRSRRARRRSSSARSSDDHARQRLRVEPGRDVDELRLEEHEAERVFEHLHVVGSRRASPSLRTIACTRADRSRRRSPRRRAARRARGACCSCSDLAPAQVAGPAGRMPTRGAPSSGGSGARGPRAATRRSASGCSRRTHSVTSSACTISFGPRATAHRDDVRVVGVAVVDRGEARREAVGRRPSAAAYAAVSRRRGGGEPVERPAPRVGRVLGAVVGPRVAVEAVLGVGVAHDLGVDRRRCERGAELLDVVDGDRLVLVAEQPEPRRLQRRDLARRARGTAGSAR